MTSRIEPLRIGLIGCGRVANAFHLPALRRVLGAQVTALAEIDPSKLNLTGESFGVARRYADYHDLLAQSDIDIVAICTPTLLHVPMALDALAAGKHVLVEKPLALIPSEAERLISAAEKSDRRITVGFVLRHHRLLQQARAAVQLNILGKVEALHAHWTIPVQLRGGLPEWRKRRSTGGGGLIDFAVHHLDLFRWLFDAEIEELYAAGRSIRSEDQTVMLTARLSNGVLAHTTISEASTDSHDFHLFGQSGALHISSYRFDGLRFDPVFAPASAARHWRRQVETLFRELPAGLSGRGEGGEYGRAFFNEWTHFLGCVRSGTSPTVTLHDGLAATRALLAAAHSLEQNAPIVVRDAPVTLSLPARPVQVQTAPAHHADSGAPPLALSVILMTLDTFESIRLTVRYLAAQTIAAQIELIMIAPSAAWAGLDEAALTAFGSYRLLTFENEQPAPSVAALYARAVQSSTVPLFVFAEDHAFPLPGWAEALVRTYQTIPDCGMISPLIRSRQQGTALAWADAILSYAPWLEIASETDPPRDLSDIPWHHACFVRAALDDDQWAALETVIDAGSNIHVLLQARGRRVVLAPGAVIEHINLSRWSAIVPAIYCIGRLFASNRSRRWSPLKRALYASGSPLIPFVRLARFREPIRRCGLRGRFALRIVAFLSVCLVVGTFGEFLGFVFGEGNSRAALKPYEFRRWQYVNPAEWVTFMERSDHRH